MEAGPFIRWAGSKRKLLPKLVPYWGTDYKRYVEPFMGSACLFYAIQPAKAVLGDANSRLVDTFVTVRDHPLAVWRRLQAIPLGPDSYYLIREMQGQSLDKVDCAAHFIFLNRFCFNGLYRTDSTGRFNVPYSSSRTGNLPTQQELSLASRALRSADLVCADFEEVLLTTKRGDFAYLDPPYAVGNRRMFRQYGPDCFGTDDLGRLAKALIQIDNRGVHFVLSYALCKEALDILGGWNTRRVFTQRNISGFSNKRRRAVEVIISNIA